MRRMRDSLSINLVYFAGLIILGSISTIAINGCGNGDAAAPVGTAPKITNVQLYDAYWIPSLAFNIGDYCNFEIYATDPDLDMVNCYITQYYPHDATTPYYGPDFLSLPSQSAADMIYYSISPTEVIGPAGSWRIEFQIGINPIFS